MSKLDTIKSKVAEAEEFSRRIWLAGLGAYGKGFDEAQGRYEKLNAETSKLFEDLVNQGEKIEAEAKVKFKEKSNEVKEKFMEKANVSERVTEIRKKLGLEAVPADDRIDELSAKIDALTDIVVKLAEK
ncbi:MAG: hypothetical protein COW84_04680 [Gammaproteobacteria bacterium CG22_combo_CG10-13_8_21_14_all_40_8]|nr:MAG: hypothetical protein COW84_04680 [Gammaproteobacteria bacterium CG22_combo_CG10-13_8_21_14_all_40_8]